jgi:hypothetical protein
MKASRLSIFVFIALLAVQAANASERLVRAHRFSFGVRPDNATRPNLLHQQAFEETAITSFNQRSNTGVEDSSGDEIGPNGEVQENCLLKWYVRLHFSICSCHPLYVDLCIYVYGYICCVNVYIQGRLPPTA